MERELLSEREREKGRRKGREEGETGRQET
jgi:hypothetical protein